jgi:hypothetical protein
LGELPNVWVRRFVIVAGLGGGVALSILLGFGLPRAGAPSEAGPLALLAVAVLLWFGSRGAILLFARGVDAELGEEASARVVAERRARYLWPLPIVFALVLYNGLAGIVAMFVVNWWAGAIALLAALIAVARLASTRSTSRP